MPGPRIPGQTTKVRSFSAFVRAANPDFDLERRKEPAWEFEGGRVRRIFYQNISKFGPYNPEPKPEPAPEPATLLAWTTPTSMTWGGKDTVWNTEGAD